MDTKKEYIVFVTQYCTPIKLVASNKADAEYQARNNYAWEPHYADIEVEEIQ